MMTEKELTKFFKTIENDYKNNIGFIVLDTLKTMLRFQTNNNMFEAIEVYQKQINKSVGEYEEKRTKEIFGQMLIYLDEIKTKYEQSIKI